MWTRIVSIYFTTDLKADLTADLQTDNATCLAYDQFGPRFAYSKLQVDAQRSQANAILLCFDRQENTLPMARRSNNRRHIRHHLISDENVTRSKRKVITSDRNVPTSSTSFVVRVFHEEKRVVLWYLWGLNPRRLNV